MQCRPRQLLPECRLAPSAQPPRWNGGLCMPTANQAVDQMLLYVTNELSIPVGKIDYYGCGVDAMSSFAVLWPETILYLEIRAFGSMRLLDKLIA